jgi:hypothetical protein
LHEWIRNGLNRVAGRALVLMFGGVLALGGGCRHTTQPVSTFPRWMIVATVVETTDPGHFAPVRGCPQVRWHYSDSAESNLVTCYHSTNVVKPWEQISQRVTVNYVVECEGYFSSEVRTVTFDPADAAVGPGRPGPEIIDNETVTLLHE